MVKLGEIQKHALRCLIEHKTWHVGCGWLWNNHSGTTRLMESLVRKGVARKEVIKSKTYPFERAIYYPTVRKV